MSLESDQIYIVRRREYSNSLSGGSTTHKDIVARPIKEKAIKLEAIFNERGEGVGGPGKEWKSKGHEKFHIPGMNYSEDHYIKPVDWSA